MWCLNSHQPTKEVSDEGRRKRWREPGLYREVTHAKPGALAVSDFSCQTEIFPHWSCSWSCSFLFAIKTILTYSLSLKAKFWCHFLFSLADCKCVLLCTPIAHSCVSWAPIACCCGGSHAYGYFCLTGELFHWRHHCILIPSALAAGHTRMPCICHGDLLNSTCSNRPFVICCVFV